jgi:formate-nitrite transporter family protein
MSNSRLTPGVRDHDHVAGQADAPVTLVEYGDFECLQCGIAFLIVKAVRRELGNRLRFVFRHLPLGEIHPHARHAAQVAEAAAAQGEFWAMHEMLFEHQTALEDADLIRYAGMLKLDAERIAQELKAGTYAKRVSEDFRGGVRSGVNGTPTFYVNEERYDGPWTDEDTFIQALRDAAERASRDASLTTSA